MRKPKAIFQATSHDGTMADRSTVRMSFHHGPLAGHQADVPHPKFHEEIDNPRIWAVGPLVWIAADGRKYCYQVIGRTSRTANWYLMYRDAF